MIALYKKAGVTDSKVDGAYVSSLFVAMNVKEANKIFKETGKRPKTDALIDLSEFVEVLPPPPPVVRFPTKLKPSHRRVTPYPALLFSSTSTWPCGSSGRTTRRATKRTPRSAAVAYLWTI